MHSRRAFLKLLAMGVIGHELDIDKLLWVPGEKTIFLPSPIYHPSYSEIIAIEWDKVRGKVMDIFERDDIFYKAIKARAEMEISIREISIPLIKNNERRTT